ncbi:MAG: photosynthetic complex assembly protein PuhC [Burkholderiales bacterium]
MSEHAEMAFPRAPLVGAAALVLAALLAVALVRLTGIGVSHDPDAAAVSVREFRFADRADGGVAILDGAADRVVDTVAPGTNGFLRSTLRGLARERKRQGAGADTPFRLVGRADGRLTLEDPATQRRVDLESFGPTNAAVFARLMTLPQ